MRNFKKRIVSFVSAIALAATILPGAELIASAADTVLSLKKDVDFSYEYAESNKFVDNSQNYQAGIAGTRGFSKSNFSFTNGTTYTFTIEVGLKADNKTHNLPTLYILNTPGGDTNVGSFGTAGVTQAMQDNHSSLPDGYSWSDDGDFFVYTKSITYTATETASRQLRLDFGNDDREKIGFKSLTISDSAGGGDPDPDPDPSGEVPIVTLTSSNESGWSQHQLSPAVDFTGYENIRFEATALSGGFNKIVANRNVTDADCFPNQTSLNGTFDGTTVFNGVTFQDLTNTANVTFYWEGNGQFQLKLYGTPIGGGTTYTISTVASPLEGGTVTGGGEKAEGSSVTLTALANDGYTFTKWQKDGVDISGATNATYTIASVAAADAGTYTAVFTQDTPANNYTVNFSGTNGTVTATAGGSPISSGDSVAAGTSVTFTATANPGYTFTKWQKNGSDIADATSETYTATVDANATYTAVFTAQSSGEVLIDQTTDFSKFGWNNETCVKSFNPSNYSTVRIVVEGCNGSIQVIANWDQLVRENNFQGTLEYTFTAEDFAKYTGDTTIRVNGDGSTTPTALKVYGTPKGGGQSDVSYDVVGPYRSGTVSASGTTLTATPRSEYQFVGWYDNAACTGNALSTSTTYTYNGTKVYAKFDYVKYSLPIIDIVTKDSEGNSGASYSEAWLGGKTKKTKYNGSAITLANSTSYNLTESTVQIKGRGNSTWALEKKPFEINFDNAVNLFNQGKAANKTWILLANHADRTLMRNQLAYTWARSSLNGIPFTTGATPVEVYMNGDYIGMYIVVEKSRVAEGRVAIDVTSETTSDMAEIGFLAEWDKLAEKNGEPQEDYYIKTNVAGFSEFFTLHSGVYSTAENDSDHTTAGGNNTNTTAIAIGNYLNAVSAAIMSGDEATIRSYVDMNSFVDMFILQEFTKNPDCGGSSFYMYKNKGANAKLTLGPAWDFDKALGDEIRVTRATDLYINGGDPESNNNKDNVNTWFKSLYGQQWFRDLVIARWHDLRSNPTTNPDNLTDQIDAFVTANSASAERNYSKWSYDMTHQFDSNVFWGDYGLSGSYFSGKTTFAAQTSALKQWILDRIAFLDTEWSGNAVTIDADDYDSEEFKYNDGGSQPAIPFVVTNSNGDVTEHDIIVTMNYTGSSKWVNVFTPILAEELRDGFGAQTVIGDDDQYGIANSFSELTGGLTIQKHAIEQNGPFTFVIPAGSPTGTYLAGVSGADSFDSITVKYADYDGIQKYEAPVGAALDTAPIFKVNKDAYGYTSKAKAGDTYYVDEKVTAVAREGYMFVNWSILHIDDEGHQTIIPLNAEEEFSGINDRSKNLYITSAMKGRTIYANFGEKQSIRYEAESFVNLVSEGYVITYQEGSQKLTNAEFYGRTWDNHPDSHPYDAPKVVTDGESVVKQEWDDTYYTDHKIVTSGYSGGKAVALTGPTSGVAIPFSLTHNLSEDLTFALGYNYGDMPTHYQSNDGKAHWYDNDLYVNIYSTAELTDAQKNALSAHGWSLSEYATPAYAGDTILNDAQVGTDSRLQTSFYKRLPINSLNWQTHNGEEPRENVQETEVTLPAGLPKGKYYVSVATDHANLFKDDADGRAYQCKAAPEGSGINASNEGNYTGTGTVGTAYYDYIEFYTASTPDMPSPITVGANFIFDDMFGNSLMTNEFREATFDEQTSQIQFHPVVPRYLQVQGYKIDYWMYTVDGVTTYVLPDGSTSVSAPTLSDLDSFDTIEEFNRLAEKIEKLSFAQGSVIRFTAHYVVKNDVYDMTVHNGRVYAMGVDDNEAPELLPKGLVYKVSNYGMVKLVADDYSGRGLRFHHWELNGQIYSYKSEVIFSAWCNANFEAKYADADEVQTVLPAAFISEDVQQFGFSDDPTVDQPEYQKVSFDCAFYIPDANNFLSCGILVAPDGGTLDALTSQNVTLTEYGTFASGLPTRSATYTAEYDQLFEKANHQVIFSLSGIKRNKHRYARAFYIYKDASGNPQVVFSERVAHVLTGTTASAD